MDDANNIPDHSKLSRKERMQERAKILDGLYETVYQVKLATAYVKCSRDFPAHPETGQRWSELAIPGLYFQRKN